MRSRLLFPVLGAACLWASAGAPALAGAGDLRTSGAPNLSGPSLLGSGDDRSRRIPGSLLGSYGPLQDAAAGGPVWATNPQPILFTPLVVRAFDFGAPEVDDRWEREERRLLAEERRLLIEERARLAAEASRPAPPVVVVTPIPVPASGDWRPRPLPEEGGFDPTSAGPTAEASAPEDLRPALLRLSVAPADTALRLDGRRIDGGLGATEALELPAGVHVLEAVGPGGERRRVIFGLAPGADRRIDIDLRSGSRMSPGDEAPFRRVAADLEQAVDR